MAANTKKSNLGRLDRATLQDAPNPANARMARLCKGEITLVEHGNNTGNTDTLLGT